MKKTGAFVFAVFVFSLGAHAQGNVVFGLCTEHATNDYGIVQDCHITASGASYMCGNCDHTPDFDPGPGIAQPPVGVNNKVFLARYKADGAFDWLYTIAGNCLSCNNGLALATDSAGNIFMSGVMGGTDTVDLDPGPGVYAVVPPGANTKNVFLVSLDSLGNFRWGFVLGTTYSTSYAYGLATDSIGNVFLAGYFTTTNNSSVDFDPGPGTNLHQCGGTYHPFLLKLTNAGILRWADVPVYQNSGAIVMPRKVETDAKGNSYVTGTMQGTLIDFDPSAAFYNLATASNGTRQQLYIAHYDSSGALLWAITLPQTSNSTATIGVTDMALSRATGKIAITGLITDGLYDLNPGTGVTTVGLNTSEFTAFVACYDTTGDLNFAFGINSGNGIGQIQSSGIDFGADEEIIWSGSLYASYYDMDPGPGSAMVVVPTSKGYIATYDTLGIFRQTFAITNANFFALNCSNADSSFVVAGRFDNAAVSDFDPGPSVYTISAPVNTSGIILVRYGAGQFIIIGTEEHEEPHFSIYPNPASQSITVENSSPDVAVVRLQDVTGRVVAEYFSPGIQLTIDVSALSPGMYFVTEENGDATSTQRIIVQ